jgi:hypothetical protein
MRSVAVAVYAGDERRVTATAMATVMIVTLATSTFLRPSAVM